MLDVVREVFAAASERLEGRVGWMYQDSIGKVTVGIGNLIDSADAAWDTRTYGAPFMFRPEGGGRIARNGDRPEASEAQVREEWSRVKGDQSLARGGHLAAGRLATLALSDEGIDLLVDRKLREFEGKLVTIPEFAALDEWPGDAQMGLFSLAWAMGPLFASGNQWPNLRAACATRDWQAAARACSARNSWLVKRNAFTRGLFRNAHWAVSEGLDIAKLYITVPGNRPKLQLGATDADDAGKGFDSDDSVSSLQRYLGFLGFFGGDVDGVFAESTRDAVVAFQQQENDLTADRGGFGVDGVVGPTTWAALGYVVPQA